ncbi:MAG: alpha-2-macroglobulin family protein [Paracoccaceae bacterium]
MMRLIYCFIALFSVCNIAAAQTDRVQNAVPDFRYIALPDTDFYGSDLSPLFDTDIPSCIRACSASDHCAGFTFNLSALACFPKSGTAEPTPFLGALSAFRVPSAATILTTGGERTADLSFLRDRDLTGARAQAVQLGMEHQSGGQDLDELLSLARERSNARDLVGTMNWLGRAVAVSDRPDLWVEFSRVLLAIRTENYSLRQEYRRAGASAAINAYLRADAPALRATSLVLLSEALEGDGRGKDMLPVLRLANDIQSRQDIDVALEKAVGKYGFRVTESTVENNASQPRICVQFSDALVQAGVDYEPFVQLPESGMVVQPDGNQLCVDGVRHGERYSLTMRAGLPSDTGEVMHRDVDVTLYVRDRNPVVRFPGRSYVLPRTGQAALPVETVNLTEVDLKLRRVSDRNLLRAIQDDFFGRPLSYWQEDEFVGEIAEDVWSGTAIVQNELNQDMTTRLPMDEAIAGLPAGIYALTASIPGTDSYDDPGATQWFVLSDMGLSTMLGNDGLHVQVRGLSDAGPRPDVEISLVNRANAVLATAKTDAEGHVLFDAGLTRGTGASAPAMVIAQSGTEDLGFLSLVDAAFDLSDRGVEGRAPSGPVDVFLTTDRGAYRAGETIYVTALSRDGDAKAIEGLPLIAILSRPDGVEYSRAISDGGQIGGHVFSLPVGVSVPRGAWRLDIKSDPKAAALASRQILVEDFLPERIDFEQELAASVLSEGDAPDLEVVARYLFGAPGAGLKVEGQISLRAADTVQGWPGYKFGTYDGRSTVQSSYFGTAETDADGTARFSVTIPQDAAEGKPLEARITTRVSDGAARPVERIMTAPVRPSTPVIGIKPLFDEVVAEGTEAAFEVIALSPELEPTEMKVRWTLNRVERRYQWYQLWGSWNWEPTTRRQRIATGEAMLSDVPLSVSEPIGWGRYELIVERIDGPYASGSVDFYAGWYVPDNNVGTPDRLELSLDRESYGPGDTAILRVVPRAAGTALVTVMSDRVIARKAVEIPQGASEIPLEVTRDWGHGAYVSAIVIRPGQDASGLEPSRALGLAHAFVEQPGRAFEVSIDVPEVARPRGIETARISVSGAQPGEDVWLSVSAVDLGILNLTGFKSPDPTEYYYGQRRLGMELRDMYGRLIDGQNGALGQVRSGGDQEGGSRFQSPPPTQDLMAVFSGPLKVDASGHVDIPIDLPAFNGTVRLMAVAWSQGAVGQAEQDMLVRDPVVVTASLPRFLSPGDESRGLLEIVHADGPFGEMQLVVSAGSGVTVGDVPSTLTLKEKGKAVLEVPIRADAVGDPEVTVTLVTPDGKALRQVLRMPIRTNDPIVAQTRRFTLAAGDNFTFSDDVFADLRPGSAKAVLSAGPLAKFDAPGLLSALDRYPYGCTEQVTSKALPLLYLSSVAQASGLGGGPDVKARVDDAIARVLTRQAANGAFGLWRAESGDFWLDAYVSDFLSRARAQGYQVPERAFSQAMDNLRNRINYAPDFDSGGEDIAYALMVLAREGAASTGDLRYYADVKGNAFDSPLAAAQLGAALASYGDQLRADRMFGRAGAIMRREGPDGPYWRVDYGTTLRDAAGVLALAVEARSDVLDRDTLTDRITRVSVRRSTQESAWTLLAAQALISTPEDSGLIVDESAVSGPFVEVLEGQSPKNGMAISAASGRTVDITLTTLGVPLVAPDAGGTGYSLEREYYTMDGARIDGNIFAVGDRFVTVLRLQPHEQVGARLMIDDPLPAGFEIDNPNLLRSGDVGDLDWLNLNEARHAEFRSDRFLAAVDVNGRSSVTLAYVTRAVTPGRFHHPAASVEDMYRPAYRARTATGQIEVR